LALGGYSILTSDLLPLDSQNARLTTRRAKLLHELHSNPHLSKFQLAKRLQTSSRVVSKEFAELRRNFSLQILSVVDPHKFGLTHRIIHFHTKSLKHSEQLQGFLKNRSNFLHNFILDQDCQRGLIVYQYPDQKDGHRLFDNHVRLLDDEFFESYYVSRVNGFHYYFSLISYDPTTNVCSLEADVVAAMLQSVKRHYKSIPAPEGMFFSQQMKFDKADFLLAHLLFGIGDRASIDFKHNLLKQFRIDLSKKTIWKRMRRLRQAHAAIPIVFVMIPGLDEYVRLMIHCTADSCEIIRILSSILPYAVIFKTNSGCELAFQRPVQCTAVTGQLIRAIHREEGVRDIELIRYQSSLAPSNQLGFVDHWDEKYQSWLLEEGDF
jgi:hypothetical protein